MILNGYSISVILPIYGVENYIEESLLSVINQTYKNFEIILVDDGTLDCSIKIGEKILNNTDCNYQILKQKNQGQGVARNTGANAAKGEWLLFLDPDDILQNNAFEEYVKLAKKEKPEVIFSGFENVVLKNRKGKFDNNKKYSIYKSGEIQRKYLFRDIIILSAGTLYNAFWYKKKQNVFPKHKVF